ncbi:MetS family NSS transporter small subunit [candidate division KSB1 bacterium]
MTFSAIVTLIFIGILVWGGFAFSLWLALNREKDK